MFGPQWRSTSKAGKVTSHAQLDSRTYVYGITPRGSEFSFATRHPERYPVGAAVEVWGKALNIGGHCFEGRWSGTKVGDRVIFVREDFSF